MNYIPYIYIRHTVYVTKTHDRMSFLVINESI